MQMTNDVVAGGYGTLKRSVSGICECLHKLIW
jgi:hypothetical protein